MTGELPDIVLFTETSSDNHIWSYVNNINYSINLLPRDNRSVREVGILTQKYIIMFESEHINMLNMLIC